MTPTTGDLLDVLVVGAGPTGLTLAGQLRAFGAGARIVDRQLDRVQESRALAVQPRTLEVLRGLGIAEELIERGNDAVWVQLHAGGRVVRIRLFGLGLDDTAYPFLLFVSQAETEQVLSDQLAAGGIRVERGVELVGFHADQDGVTCTLRHRDGRAEQVWTRYLVGCDGAHSTVRRGAGIPFKGGAYPQTFALADLEADGLDRDAAHAFAGEIGILLFFPLGRPASWRMLAMHPSLQGRREPARPSLEELQTLADAMTGDSVRLHDPVWRTYFGLQHRHATRYQAGRDLPGRRCRPRPQSRRCPGHEHRHPGRLEPGLEARPGHPRGRRRGPAGLLRRRTTPGRRLRGPLHRPGLLGRDLDQPTGPRPSHPAGPAAAALWGCGWTGQWRTASGPSPS